MPTSGTRFGVVVGLLGALTVAAIVIATQAVVNGWSNAPSGEPSNLVVAEVTDLPIREMVGTTIELEPAFERVVAPPVSGVITRDGLPAGADFDAGAVLGSVAERPVIALSGAIPAYRSLEVGATGSDVAQLQTGLQALGHVVADRSGTYGRSTAAAVYSMYLDRGFSAVAPGGSPATRRDASVPFGEVTFLPSLPAQSVTACGTTGMQTTTSLCSVVGGATRLLAVVSIADGGRLSTGLSVEIDASDGETLLGVLGTMETPDAPGPPTTDQEPSAVVESVRFALDLPDVDLSVLPPEAQGRIIVQESEPGELTIVASAIRSDGGATHWLERPDGDREPIELGFCAAGKCVVVSGKLRVGQSFVVPVTR